MNNKSPSYNKYYIPICGCSNGCLVTNITHVFYRYECFEENAASGKNKTLCAQYSEDYIVIYITVYC